MTQKQATVIGSLGGVVGTSVNSFMAGNIVL
jgi:hypothetical protein